MLEHVEIDAKKKAPIYQCLLSKSKAENFPFYSEEEGKKSAKPFY